jgi:hypothetical protein
MDHRVINRVLLSGAFSVMLWMIVDIFLINIPFWKCFIFEIITIILTKLYIFVCTKLGLVNYTYGQPNTHQ